MRKVRELNEVVREFNGLSAKVRKDPSKENKALLQDCITRLAKQAEVLLDDKAVS